jgi:putative drug exporter of the RND superfamily
MSRAAWYEAPPTNIGPPPRRVRPPAVEMIAGWSARYRKTAVFGWLALVAVAYLIGQLLGSPSLQQNDLGQAGQAEQTLQHLRVTTPTTEAVLIQARTPGQTFATDPAMRQAVRQVTAALSRRPDAAAGINSPLRPGGQALVSANGRSALVTFNVPGPAADVTTAVTPALSAVAKVQASHPGLLVAEAGDASLGQAVNNQIGSDFGRATETSVPLTLILLVGVFGTLVAAGIPVLLALTSALTATWLLAIPGHWLPVGSQTSTVVLLVGMAVGIDYSLFFLRRQREERSRGADLHQAITTAARTSGRAIVVSGMTVMTALAGLFLTGYALFTGMAIGAIVVVGIAVTGSLTVLPALLSWLGDRVEAGRIPFLRRRRAAAPSKAWSTMVRRVVRRPLLWGGAATVVMLAIAAPALGMRLAYPAIDAPADLPVVSTIEAIQAAFPQSPAPAEVVVTGQHLTGPVVTGAISKLESLAAKGGPIREPVTVISVADGRALIVSVPLAGNGGDSASYTALDALRDQILPRTFGGTGVSYAVAGDTAANHDNASQLSARTPLVLAVVAAVAFCLLLLCFRSVVLPLVSIALNFLSVTAAYGLITFIFQDGRLQGLLGYASSGAITPWVPLFLFTFLFGISMDYHVFILSRIRELRQRGETTVGAVTVGIASSAGVVSSAALIMVAVFSIFIGMGQVELKMLGVGLTAAILLDATIVRGVLLPAVMTLLGDRCWYLPRWLSWLPGRTPASSGSTESGRPAGAPRQGEVMNETVTTNAATGLQARTGNWATRGIVAAGRGIALIGLTLAGLVLWLSFAIAVTLAPLGVGLPAIPVTVRAIRRLETRVRRLAGDWCGAAISDPYQPEPARPEGQPAPGFWARFGFLIADPATWRDLVWITVDTLVGWLLILTPAGLIAWGLFGLVMPAVWHPIVAAHGNNWYAFIHVTTASTAWLSAALGIAFIALGLLTAPWLLRRYGTLAQSLLAPARTNYREVT